MKLEELEGPPLEKADEVLDEAAHDVAKYMALTARNVDPEKISEELTAELLQDVRAAGGRGAAWDLWTPLSQRLGALAADPEIEGIDEAMKSIAELASATPDTFEAARLARLVKETSSRITALRKALRRRLIEARR